MCHGRKLFLLYFYSEVVCYLPVVQCGEVVRREHYGSNFLGKRLAAEKHSQAISDFVQ